MQGLLQLIQALQLLFHPAAAGWCFEGIKMALVLDGTLGVVSPSVTLGYTVAALPASGVAGCRAHVTNSLLPVFGSVVVGGGVVSVPVFDTGTSWIVG